MTPPLIPTYREVARAWKRLSLARQLFLAMFTSVVIVSSAYFAYDLKVSNRCLDNLERSTMESVFPVLQRIIEHSMIHKSRENIRDLFAAAAGGSGVAESMMLLDDSKHGIDLEDLAAGRSPRRFSAPVYPRQTHLISDFAMYSGKSCVRCHDASKPVLGYVRLVAPHAQKARAMRANFWHHVLLLSLMAVVLGVWALLLVRLMVEQPLTRIEKAMRDVKAGRLSTRIRHVDGSEFGKIAEGFNAMVAELEADRREILDLHRRQVAQLERLVAVGELSAHLAHEIRNPLTGISTAVQVLQADQPAGHPKREVLGKILGQLTRMDQTMGNFLRFARMPEAQIRGYELPEALQRTFFLIEPRLKSQRIEWRADVPKDLPGLLGDPAQIEQVLLNLCLNAVQAMPSGGRLTVSARRKESEVRLEISDTGSGIPADQLDRIFQPFFTTRENGSGLGLPISRQIILAHGGDLSLESEPRRGTTVYIRLPVSPNGA